MYDANQGDDAYLLDAIRNRVETRAVEYKESQPLEVLKWRLCKTIIAMANLRDGGCVIVGVSERNGAPELTGVTPDHEKTYDQDGLIATVNTYARPAVSLTVRVLEYDAKRFIGVRVRQFDRTPIICGNPTPQAAGADALRRGDIVARTKNRISTSKVGDADLVAEILEIAAEQRATEIISTAQRMGLRLPSQARDEFARERASFENRAE